MPDEYVHSDEAIEQSSSSIIDYSLGLQCLFVAAEWSNSSKEYTATKAEDSFTATVPLAIIFPHNIQLIVYIGFKVDSSHRAREQFFGNYEEENDE